MKTQFDHRIQLLRVHDLPSIVIDTVGNHDDSGQRYTVTSSVYSQRLYVIRVRGIFPRGVYAVVLEGSNVGGQARSDSWTITTDDPADLSIDVQLQSRAYTDFTIRVVRDDLPAPDPSSLAS